MSWCAGFSDAFYQAYFEVNPKQPGFEKRRDLYLVYVSPYLLVFISVLDGGIAWAYPAPLGAHVEQELFSRSPDCTPLVICQIECVGGLVLP
jgi:Fructosamine kinase